MKMHMLDVLAAVAMAKLEEIAEEERKRKNGIQLQPLAKCKGKRSVRVVCMESVKRVDDKKVSDDVHQRESGQPAEETKMASAKCFDNKKISDDRHKPESGQPAEETNDRQQNKVEEEFKKFKRQQKKRKVGKVVNGNHYENADYDPKQKKEKKRKIIIQDFDSPPLSEEFKQRIKGRAESGVVGKEIKVIEKALTFSDVQPNQNRFSIPVNQMKEEFLLPAEQEFLKERTSEGRHCNTMKVKIIEPSGKVGEVSLSRWVMKKECGKSSVSYVLKGNWKRMLKENRLKEGDQVQLWAVRIGENEELCLAFVVVARNQREEEEEAAAEEANAASSPSEGTVGEAEEAKAAAESGEKVGEAEEASASSSSREKFREAEESKPAAASPPGGTVGEADETRASAKAAAAASGGKVGEAEEARESSSSSGEKDGEADEVKASSS